MRFGKLNDDQLEKINKVKKIKDDESTIADFIKSRRLKNIRGAIVTYYYDVFYVLNR